MSFRSLCALLGSALLVACGRAEETPLARTAVRVAPIEMAGAAPSARYSARIEPALRVELAFKVSGHIERLETTRGPAGEQPLSAGDVVEAGARLASLRAVDFRQRAEEARAGAARAQVELVQAKSDAERSEKLAQSGAISAATLESARLRVQSASAAVRGSEVQVQEALTQTGDSVLRSPLLGTILSRTVEEGSLVAAGAPIFTVARTDPMKAVIGVPDVELAELRVGDAETVLTEAYPNARFEGRVTRIAPAADPQSKTFEIEISIPNPQAQLKIGMVAAVALAPRVIGPAAGGHSVPLAALVRSPLQTSQFAVFALEGSGDSTHVRAVDVQLGTSWGSSVPVTEGLTGKERIVVQGAGLLSDGERVEVIQ
jgi:RND family efflux transporter MFP subunit